MLNRISEDLPDRMPKNISKNISKYMSEDMPDRMPDKMPENMLNKISEDLSVRKYINIMVGIIRNKKNIYIFFNIIILNLYFKIIIK
jgi:hypothetical protein